MLFHKKKNIPPIWTQEEEEQAYQEFLEACKTFPRERLLSQQQLNKAHKQIFGAPKFLSPPLLRARKFWVTAAAAAAIAGTMMTAGAFQSQIRRFFLRESAIATDVEVLPPDDGENSDTISYYWDAAYVPEGYNVFFTDISELSTTIMYNSLEETSLEISTMPLSVIPSFDTENTQKQEIEIAGSSGYLYTTIDDSKTRLLLLCEDCIVLVSGEISQNELLKIVDSLYTVNISINQEELQ